MKKTTGKTNTKTNSGIQMRSRDLKENKIVPLGSRILIRPFTKEELAKKNSFGIILPGKDSKEKSEQGIILATGPGEWREGKLVPTTVKVGEKVAFSKYGYEDIHVGDEELYLIKEENILAILK